MRLLLDRLTVGPAGGSEQVDDERLRRLYAVPRTPWLRVNMVASLDGAGAGADGRTGSINNAPDHRVFHLLRGTADAIVVGAGTARTEGYAATDRPLVVVTRRGSLPPRLLEAPGGSVLLATCAAAPGLAESRERLGDDQVLCVGQDSVDLPRLRAELESRGMVRLLSEGGPRLLADLLGAGVVDELCLTWVPLLVGGDQTRIVAGAGLRAHGELAVLLEEDGTLLGRWMLGGDAGG